MNGNRALRAPPLRPFPLIVLLCDVQENGVPAMGEFIGGAVQAKCGGHGPPYKCFLIFIEAIAKPELRNNCHSERSEEDSLFNYLDPSLCSG